MKTIALRYGDHFAPECGTIEAHQQLIDKIGYVWYGKLGSPVSMHIIKELAEQDNTKILLINSGKIDRYWAHVSEISREIPALEEIPKYYRHMIDKFKTWFKVTEFEVAPKNIVSKCIVVSSGMSLSETSRKSMSPYFIIQCEGV